MSKNFQLQVVQKALTELGHGVLAEELARRLAMERSQDDLSSSANPLQELISNGDYSTILSILQGSQDDFHFSNELRNSIASLSTNERNLATYLVLRTSFIEKILLISLGSAYPSAEQEAFAYLKDKVSPAFDLIDKSDTSVLILQKLSKERESSVLVQLAMAPPNRDQLESTIFNPSILLSDTALSLTHHDDSSYFLRLRNSLASILHKTVGIPEATGGDVSNPHVVIPDNYLSEVIRKAMLYDSHQSIYYLPPRNVHFSEFDLISDYSSQSANTKDDLPIHLLYTLHDHKNEVWYTKFSPSGRFLATGSMDGTCLIYDVLDHFKLIVELDANSANDESHFVSSTFKPALDKKKGIIYFAWEPHERYIVTCCLDTVIRVWNVSNVTSGRRLTRSMNSSEQVSLVSCFTLGQRMRTWPCEFLNYEKDLTPHFVVGSPDKVLKVFTVDGQEVLDFYSDADEWSSILDNAPPTAPANQVSSSRSEDQPHDMPELQAGVVGNGSQFNRINDLAITPNGKVLVTANNDKSVLFYKIPDLFDPATTTSRIASLTLTGRLTSCNLSANGKYMLISIAPEELQVWDISPLDRYEKPFLKQKFLGQSQASYMIRSGFGYLTVQNMKEELVLSGSDDGFIYIWKFDTGQLITRVKGHNGLCNSVDWNRFYVPKSGKDYGKYWCSVGDDHMVKIWGPKEI